MGLLALLSNPLIPIKKISLLEFENKNWKTAIAGTCEKKKVKNTQTEKEKKMKFECSELNLWKEALSSYSTRLESLNKPNLISFDDFYRNQLPPILRNRNPNPYITTAELSKLMQWKLTRGKWRYSLSLSLSLSLFLNFIKCIINNVWILFFFLRPRLLDFVSSLDEAVVKSASEKAFQSLPDVSKAVSELTVLKGVGPATASAVLAAYAPDVAPFMSDEV